ncbi:MAG: radical SAM protein [Treponema sp.]|nr:radical SAM protein [Treponema sp.]
MIGLYKHCLLCPRSCGVDRLAGEKGFCKESAELRAASAVLHRGEEPPLSGKGGSGTIFICGCNLGCAFCQNYQISQGERGAPLGRAVTTAEFAQICIKLMDSGAENINIVTGSHAVPAIVRGIIAAKDAGLTIPVLWNSSAYESIQTLELLKDHIDIYLPDLKTLDSSIAHEFYNAGDYPQTAAAAILKMIDMVVTRHGENPANREKIIIRHLILPGRLESTRSVLRWFAENAKDRALLSLMTQYTPVGAGEKTKIPAGYLHKSEYETVLGWLREYAIEEGFCQELVTGSDWLPDFYRTNPFSSELSVPVWHWSDGDISL